MNRYVLASKKFYPRCLNEFKVQVRSTLPPAWQNDDVDFVSAFELGCQCGNNQLSVLGIPDDEIGLLGPIYTNCSCGSRQLLFDVQKHGYDAESGHLSGYQTSDRQIEALTCSACAAKEFALIPWFTYQFEPDEFQNIEEASLPDYFDGFGIDLVCSSCNTLNFIGQYECA